MQLAVGRRAGGGVHLPAARVGVARRAAAPVVPVRVVVEEVARLPERDAEVAAADVAAEVGACAPGVGREPHRRVREGVEVDPAGERRDARRGGGGRIGEGGNGGVVRAEVAVVAGVGGVLEQRERPAATIGGHVAVRAEGRDGARDPVGVDRVHPARLRPSQVRARGRHRERLIDQTVAVIVQAVADLRRARNRRRAALDPAARTHVRARAGARADPDRARLTRQRRRSNRRRGVAEEDVPECARVAIAPVTAARRLVADRVARLSRVAQVELAAEPYPRIRRRAVDLVVAEDAQSNTVVGRQVEVEALLVAVGLQRVRGEQIDPPATARDRRHERAAREAREQRTPRRRQVEPQRLATLGHPQPQLRIRQRVERGELRLCQAEVHRVRVERRRRRPVRRRVRERRVGALGLERERPAAAAARHVAVRQRTRTPEVQRVHAARVAPRDRRTRRVDVVRHPVAVVVHCVAVVHRRRPRRGRAHRPEATRCAGVRARLPACPDARTAGSTQVVTTARRQARRIARPHQRLKAKRRPASTRRALRRRPCAARSCVIADARVDVVKAGADGNVTTAAVPIRCLEAERAGLTTTGRRHRRVGAHEVARRQRGPRAHEDRRQ